MDVVKQYPVRSAFWALRVAGFAFLLMLLACITHWRGAVDVLGLLLLAGVIWLLLILVVVLCVIALLRIWFDGGHGVRRVGLALGVVSIAALPYVLVIWLAFSMSAAADVSTRIDDPPTCPAQATKPMGTLLQANNVSRFVSPGEADPGVLAEAIRDIFSQENWTLLEARQTSRSADRYTSLCAVAPFTDLRGWPSIVTVRLQVDAASVVVDVRSTTYLGSHDLGANRQRIDMVLSRIDEFVAAHPDNEGE